jgi:hypothetical protein
MPKLRKISDHEEILEFSLQEHIMFTLNNSWMFLSVTGDAEERLAPVYRLHIWNKQIPRYGIRLAWAIWRLKLKGLVRTRYSFVYGKMIGPM